MKNLNKLIEELDNFVFKEWKKDNLYNCINNTFSNTFVSVTIIFNILISLCLIGIFHLSLFIGVFIIICWIFLGSIIIPLMISKIAYLIKIQFSNGYINFFKFLLPILFLVLLFISKNNIILVLLDIFIFFNFFYIYKLINCSKNIQIVNQDSKNFIICANCNKKIKNPKLDICPYCGKNLYKKVDLIKCPVCGLEYEKDKKKCPYCGSQTY